MQLYTNSIQDRYGNALKGAQITVSTDAGALATLYSDNGVTPTANPLSADASGEFSFYCANGRYSFTVAANGMQPETVSAFEMWDALELRDSLIVDAAAAVQVVVNNFGDLNAAVAQADASKNAAGVSETNSGVSAGLAATAKTDAELARDASFVTGPKYATEALGRAAVADGINFMVQGAGDVAAYEYLRVNSTTSTPIASYPSSPAVQSIKTRANANDGAAQDKLADGNTWGWYENDLRYITKDGSNNASAWADKLGSSNTLVQATGSKQPVWSATDGLLFDGADDFMNVSSALSIPVTIYVVMQYQNVTLAGSNYPIDGYAANSIPIIRQSNGTGGPGRMHMYKGNYIPANGYSGGTENTMRPTLPYLVTAQFNGVSSRFQINQKTAIVGDSGIYGGSSIGGLTIGSAGGGAAAFANAYFREIIVRSVVDDAATIAQIQAYLFAKHRMEVPMYGLFGQSNAGGQALTSSAPTEYQSAFSNAMIYDTATANDFQGYDPAINAQTSTSCFGIENSLLRNLYARKGVKPWLIKHGPGNTALYPGANPGGGPDWYPDTAGGQYATSISKIQAAVAWLEPGVVVPVFKGVVFMQGEADTTNSTWANSYYANLIYFCRKLEAAIVLATGQKTSPQFVIGRIASTDGVGGAVATATVKAAQDRFGTSFAVPVLNNDEYTKAADQLHYDAAGLIRFGNEVFDIFKRG